jgi:hypothetical protein
MQIRLQKTILGETILALAPDNEVSGLKALAEMPANSRRVRSRAGVIMLTGDDNSACKESLAGAPFQAKAGLPGRNQ